MTTVVDAGLYRTQFDEIVSTAIRNGFSDVGALRREIKSIPNLEFMGEPDELKKLRQDVSHCAPYLGLGDAWMVQVAVEHILRKKREIRAAIAKATRERMPRAAGVSGAVAGHRFPG